MFHLKLEPLSGKQAWTGVALTSVTSGDPAATRLSSLPTQAQWSRAIDRLCSDPSSQPGYEVLKFSDTSEVFRVRIESESVGMDVICKRNQRTGMRRRLAAMLGLRSLRSEFDRSLALHQAGIDSALPLAQIRRSSAPPEEWSIHEFLKNAVDLDHLLLAVLPRMDATRARAVKVEVTKRLVDLFLRLRRHKLHHRDLKASNVMVMNVEGRPEKIRLCLIDLEGLKRGKRSFGDGHFKPVARLAASVKTYRTVTRSDFYRFLRSYQLGLGTSEFALKDRYRHLARMASRYVLNARARKRDRIDGYQPETVH